MIKAKGDKLWLLSIVFLNVTDSIVAFGVAYLINMKGIGKGSQPSWAIPFGLFSLSFFQVIFWVFAELPQKRIALILLLILTAGALVGFLYLSAV